eukprot:scaffold155442_cov26-Prasinocladus_malaysianus.AAC.2
MMHRIALTACPGRAAPRRCFTPQMSSRIEGQDANRLIRRALPLKSGITVSRSVDIPLAVSRCLTMGSNLTSKRTQVGVAADICCPRTKQPSTRCVANCETAEANMHLILVSERTILSALNDNACRVSDHTKMVGCVG